MGNVLCSKIGEWGVTERTCPPLGDIVSPRSGPPRSLPRTSCALILAFARRSLVSSPLHCQQRRPQPVDDCGLLCGGKDLVSGRPHRMASRRPASGAKTTSCRLALQVFAPPLRFKSFSVCRTKGKTPPQGQGLSFCGGKDLNLHGFYPTSPSS